MLEQGFRQELPGSRAILWGSRVMRPPLAPVSAARGAVALPIERPELDNLIRRVALWGAFEYSATT